MPKLKALSVLLLLLAVVSVACVSTKTKGSLATATLSPATTLTPGATGTMTPSAATQSPATTQTPVVANGVSVTVQVDFTGASTVQPVINGTVTVSANSTAWDAVRQAVGEEHLTYTDYGGSLGIFITAFYDVAPAGNKYWEFDVNGKSSDVGVSTYIVKNKDVIEFKVASS